MATIRTRTYESKNSYQDVFTRVGLDVESVATLTNPLFGNLTADTNKPWVGNASSSDGTFEILQTNSSVLPLRFLEGNFFDIFIHGEVSADHNKTVIDVKFKLGGFYVIAFLLAYIFPIMLIIQFISHGDWDSIKGLSFWFLAFDVIPTLLLVVQLNRTENKVIDLLGAG
ncbi:MAG: hypothetical protein HYZ44_14565 [Bacteroidetes bacterium]|nr:hypothetical protein [Bacteroidota bacterium]